MTDETAAKTFKVYAQIIYESIIARLISTLRKLFTQENIEIEQGRNEVTTILSAEDENYKMDHPNRGHALIFNHYEYLIQPRREATTLDVKRLRNTLKKLGFKVHVYTDLCVKYIERVLRKYSEMDHTDNDCILIAVLTHGESGGILQAYDAAYKIQTLWEHFTADKCPSLAQKPKIIILQACRGYKISTKNCSTLKVTNETFTSITSGEMNSAYHEVVNEKLTYVETNKQVIKTLSYSLPTNADIILAAATADGFVSFRNLVKGSIFIQALCEELLKKPEKREFLNVLTRTNRRVAIEFESNDYFNRRYHEKKQVSCFYSMLTRNLYFKPKMQGLVTAFLTET